MTPTQPSQAVEAAELLRICQTNLGCDKYSLGREDQQFWERIDACRAALTRQQEVAAPVGEGEVEAVLVDFCRVTKGAARSRDRMRYALERFVASRVPVALPAEPMTVDARRGTDAQILFERKLTCEAIEGAMAFGYEGSNPPPEATHWLTPFWELGKYKASLEDRVEELEAATPAPKQGDAKDAARMAALAERANWVGESVGGHWVIKLHNKRHTSFLQTVDAILASKATAAGEGK